MPCSPVACALSSQLPGNGTSGECGTTIKYYQQTCVTACNQGYQNPPTRTCLSSKTLSAITQACTPSPCALDALAPGNGTAGLCNTIAVTTGEIGRAVQQECRDRSRMPSSA
eukprot:TRINITY_DN10480_c0_g2_i1.p1 TRINITY_DN10480_c0_g2~~TRINITY_DN10480_c0_g2_i1.p1  ORF type:complete len:112 (+),score=15.75 TRINITY_DN10480_c0_g2_i1:341-676(+)